MKICHFSSLHHRFSNRVFQKQLKSLVCNGKNEVYYIVADGKGDEIKDGVKIIDVGRAKNRRDRLKNINKAIYDKCLLIDCDIYQFHDPELIIQGVKLAKLGKNVIFDSHEDSPAQYFGRRDRSFFNRLIVSNLLKFFERIKCAQFAGIIAATDHIADKFSKFHNNVIPIRNYPILKDQFVSINWSNKKDDVCFIGGMTEIRGIRELIDAMEDLPYKLHLVGKFTPPSFRDKCMQSKGWKNVIEHGFLSREESKEILKISKIGIVTYLPHPNHTEAQPNKIFEYLVSGVAIVCSNFPLWKKLIGKSSIAVDPSNPSEISKAIVSLINNDKIEQEVINGQKYALQNYSWHQEAKRLVEFYENILKNNNKVTTQVGCF